MRTLRFNLIACAVAGLALAGASSAQMTKYQQNENLGMEAHIGKLTGHVWSRLRGESLRALGRAEQEAAP